MPGPILWRPSTNLASTAAPPALSSPAAPDLRELLRGNFFGVTQGPWHRWVDAKWLGPYTPSHVQHWVRKLMRRDPQIALGLCALKSPFFGIEYRLQGGDPRARAFIRKTVLENRPFFERLLWSILNALDFGFSSHELLWDLQDVDLNSSLDEHTEQGDESISGTMKGAFVLREVSDIDPDRVEILIDPRGKFLGLRVDSRITLPADKVLHAVNQLEWRNWWGEAVLDHTYNPWYWSNFLNLFLMRYLEQKGNPPLIGYAPWESRFDNTQPISGQTGQNTLDVLNAQLMSLRGGGVATLPAEFDEKSGKQMWDVHALEVGERVDQFLPALNHYEALKLRGLYVPERIATQDSSVGSHAMSGVHLDVFFSNLEVIKRFLVLATINEGVIRPLCQFNFGKSVSMPFLEASELSRASRELLADIVSKSLEIPRTLPDGRIYNAAQLVDINRALQALNVPSLRAQDVAEEPPMPQMPTVPGVDQPPSNGQSEPSKPGAAPGSPPKAKPQPPAPSMTKFAQTLGDAIANSRREPTIEIHNHLPAPVTNIAPPPPAAIKVEVAAPSVTVKPENHFDPTINVRPAPPAPPAAKVIEVNGPAGKIRGEIRPKVEA